MKEPMESHIISHLSKQHTHSWCNDGRSRPQSSCTMTHWIICGLIEWLTEPENHLLHESLTHCLYSQMTLNQWSRTTTKAPQKSVYIQKWLHVLVKTPFLLDEFQKACQEHVQVIFQPNGKKQEIKFCITKWKPVS